MMLLWTNACVLALCEDSLIIKSFKHSAKGTELHSRLFLQYCLENQTFLISNLMVIVFFILDLLIHRWRLFRQRKSFSSWAYNDWVSLVISVYSTTLLHFSRPYCRLELMCNKIVNFSFSFCSCKQTVDLIAENAY